MKTLPLLLGVVSLLCVSDTGALGQDGADDGQISRVDGREDVWCLDPKGATTSCSWLVETSEGSSVLFVGELDDETALTVLDLVQRSNLSVHRMFLTSGQVPGPVVFRRIIDGLSEPLVFAEMSTIEGIALKWRGVPFGTASGTNSSMANSQSERYQYPVINAFVGQERFKVDSQEILAVGGRSGDGGASMYYLPEKGLVVVGRVDRELGVSGGKVPDIHFAAGMVRLLRSFDEGSVDILSTDRGMLGASEVIRHLCLGVDDAVGTCRP